MKTIPIPVRLDKALQETLRLGSKRTPYTKQELIRLTLRRHLQEVVEVEAKAADRGPLTNIKPWPESAVARAYRKMGHEWDEIEEAGCQAQGKPNFND